MEQKQIVAILLIIIIIAGVAIGLYFFLPASYGAVVVGQLVTPGAPSGTPRDHIIVIGILDPMTEIQGEGAWKGSYLAVDKINSAGGITVDGEKYYFGLIAEDTYEADTSIDVSVGTAAATKIITEGAQYIIGGFRTESVLAYEEAIMDAKMLFFGTGASTDIFCDHVLDDYARYQYFFRAMPINSTSLATSLLMYLLYLKGYMTAVTGHNITKVAIIREDLEWTSGMHDFLNYYLPLFGFNIVKEIAYPITAASTDFATYWQQIDDAEAQITVPVISAQGGILMSTQYASVQPKTLLAGIDVMSQLDSYWNETNGGCRYEVQQQAMIRTNKTTKSIAFWDAFRAAYNADPLYTAVGSYDAVYLLKYGITQAQSFNSTEIVPYLEALTTTHPYEGVAGNVAYTPGHDLFVGYSDTTIYSISIYCQWQAGGHKACVSTGGLLYPEYIVTNPLELPPWGINE